LAVAIAVAVMLVMAWRILAIARAVAVMAWWARMAVVVTAAQYQRYRDEKQTQEFHRYFPVLMMR
jgi:hypothetical protein